METRPHSLEELVASSLDLTVPAEIAAMAEYLRNRHGEGVAAILAYGSCLRGVAASESLIDLYVLLSAPSVAGTGRFAQLACEFVPPNVYYAETVDAGMVLRCKYAMLPLQQFSRWMEPRTSNPYFWARFAQPSALVYCVDVGSRADVIAAIVTALRTAYGNAKSLGTEPLLAWQRLFENTYATELRAERSDRAQDLVSANRDYFEHAAALLADAPSVEGNWRWRRLAGRAWSVARLIKAAFTFTGGADYLVWKIERHSGEKIILNDWQRRHPLLASLMLLPRLLGRGAIR